MISNEDKELYRYAIKIAIQWLLNVIAIIVIASSLKMVKECLVLLLPFFTLRKFTGGYHSNRFITCFLSSIAILSICLFSIKYELLNKNIIFAFLTVSVITIIVFSPVENTNKPLSTKEIGVYRKISLIVLFLLIVILIVIENSSMFYPLSTGIIITGVMLMISKTKQIKKEKCNEKEKNC